MAIVRDPGGAAVSLWQPGTHFGAELVNVPGSFCWNELITPEPEAAQAFYGDLFGWNFERDDNPENDYWMIRHAGRLNGGLMRRPPQMGEIPPAWMVYFHVANLPESLTKVTELGGTIFSEPMEIGVGTFAVIGDAEGGASILIQMSVEPDE
jgi:hypothetical protein